MASKSREDPNENDWVTPLVLTAEAVALSDCLISDHPLPHYSEFKKSRNDVLDVLTVSSVIYFHNKTLYELDDTGAGITFGEVAFLAARTWRMFFNLSVQWLNHDGNFVDDLNFVRRYVPKDEALAWLMLKFEHDRKRSPQSSFFYYAEPGYVDFVRPASRLGLDFDTMKAYFDMGVTDLDVIAEAIHNDVDVSLLKDLVGRQQQS
jgi:hypothetical protein